jgi:hypothetical protein
MSGDEKKKDLTGLHELPQADPVPSESGEDPSAFSVQEPVEQIQDFESLDQIGMMDHPATPEEQESASAPEETPPVMEEPAPFPESTPDIGAFQGDPFPGDAPPPEADPTPDFSSDPIFPEFPVSNSPPPPTAVLDEIRQYSEAKKEAPFDPGVRNEFHLLISGEFDTYSRDKLLLFLDNSAIGMTSSELDFQIKMNRVLLPRISEFSGIKLIQELRDSGLSFILKNSDPEDSLHVAQDEGVRIKIDFSESPNLEQELPIYVSESYDVKAYALLDSIQLVQFLRAEILEVEKSELFQELLDRMTASLRKRAQLKGAHALTHLKHTVTPLRLPSQYQVELSASLLKKI